MPDLNILEQTKKDIAKYKATFEEKAASEEKEEGVANISANPFGGYSDPFPEQVLAEKYQPMAESFTPEEEQKATQNMTEYIAGAENSSSTTASAINHIKVGSWIGKMDEEIAESLQAGDEEGANELSEFKYKFIQEHRKAVEKGDPNAVQTALNQFGQTIPFMWKIEVARNVQKLKAYGVAKVGQKALGNTAFTRKITQSGINASKMFLKKKGEKTVYRKGVMGLVRRAFAKQAASYALSDAVLTPTQSVLVSTGAGAVPAVILEGLQNLVFAGMVVWDVVQLSRFLKKDEKTDLLELKNNSNFISPMGAASERIFDQIQGASYSEIAAKGPEYAKRLDPDVLRGGAMLEASIESLFSPARIIGPVGTATGELFKKGFAKMFLRGTMEKGIKSRILLHGAKVAGGVAYTGLGEASEEGGQAAVRQKYHQESLKAILEENPELATAAAINSEITRLVDSEAKDYLKTFVDETAAAIPVSLMFGIVGLPGYGIGVHRDIKYDRLEKIVRDTKAEYEAELEKSASTTGKAHHAIRILDKIDKKNENKDISGWDTKDLIRKRYLGERLQEYGQESDAKDIELMGTDLVNEMNQSLTQGAFYDFLTARHDTGPHAKDSINAILFKIGLLESEEKDAAVIKEEADLLFKEFMQWGKDKHLDMFDSQEEMFQLLLGRKYNVRNETSKHQEATLEGLRKLIGGKKFSGRAKLDDITMLSDTLGELGVSVKESDSVEDMVQKANDYIKEKDNEKREQEEREKKEYAETQAKEEEDIFRTIAETMPEGYDTAQQLEYLKKQYRKQTGKSTTLSNYKIKKQILGKTWKPGDGKLENDFLNSVGDGNEEDAQALTEALEEPEINLGLTKRAIRRILKREKGEDFFKGLFPELEFDHLNIDDQVNTLAEQDILKTKKTKKKTTQKKTSSPSNETKKQVGAALDAISDKETQEKLRNEIKPYMAQGEFDKALAYIEHNSDLNPDTSEEQSGSSENQSEAPENQSEAPAPEAEKPAPQAPPSEPAPQAPAPEAEKPAPQAPPEGGKPSAKEESSTEETPPSAEDLKRYDIEERQDEDIGAGDENRPFKRNMALLQKKNKEDKNPNQKFDIVRVKDDGYLLRTRPQAEKKETPPEENEAPDSSPRENEAPSSKLEPVETRKQNFHSSLEERVRKYADNNSSGYAESIKILDHITSLRQKLNAAKEKDNQTKLKSKLEKAKEALAKAQQKESQDTVPASLGVAPRILQDVYRLLRESVKITPDPSFVETALINKKPEQMMIARGITSTSTSKPETIRAAPLLRSLDGTTVAVQVPLEYINYSTGELRQGVRTEWVYLGDRQIYESNEDKESNHYEELVGLQLSFVGDLERDYGGKNPFIAAVRRVDGEPFFVVHKQTVKDVQLAGAIKGKVPNPFLYAPVVPWLGGLGKSVKPVSINGTDSQIVSETSEAIRTASENGLIDSIKKILRGSEKSKGFIATADMATGGIQEVAGKDIDNTIKTAIHNALYKIVVKSIKKNSKKGTDAQLLDWVMNRQIPRKENENIEGIPDSDLTKKDKKKLQKELQKPKKKQDSTSIKTLQTRINAADTWRDNNRKFIDKVKREISELIPGTREQYQRDSINSWLSTLSEDARNKLWDEFVSGFEDEYNLQGEGVKDDFVGKYSGEGFSAKKIPVIGSDGREKRGEKAFKEATEKAKNAAIKIAKRRFPNVRKWRAVQRDGEWYATPTSKKDLSPFIELIFGEYARRYKAGSWRIGELISGEKLEVAEDGTLIDNDSILVQAINRIGEIVLEGEITEENASFKLTPAQEKNSSLKKKTQKLKDLVRTESKKHRYSSTFRPMYVQPKGKTNTFELKKGKGLYRILQSVPFKKREKLKKALGNVAIDEKLQHIEKQLSNKSDTEKNPSLIVQKWKLNILRDNNVPESVMTYAREAVQNIKKEIAIEKSTRELLSAFMTMANFSKLSHAEKREVLTELDMPQSPGRRPTLFDEKNTQGVLYEINDEGEAVFPDQKEEGEQQSNGLQTLSSVERIDAKDWIDEQIARLNEEGTEITEERIADLAKEYRDSHPDAFKSDPFSNPSKEGQRLLDNALGKQNEINRNEMRPSSSFPAMSEEQRKEMEENKERRERQSAEKLEQNRREVEERRQERLNREKETEENSSLGNDLRPETDPTIYESKSSKDLQKELNKKFPNRDKTPAPINERIPNSRKAYREFVDGARMPQSQLENIIKLEAKKMRLSYRKIKGGYVLSKNGQDRLIISQTEEQIISDQGVRKGASTEFRINEVDLVTIANIGAGVGAVRHELAEWSFKRLLSPSEQALIKKTYGSPHEWANAMETWTGSRKHNRVNVIMNKVANFFRRILGMAPLKVDEFVENSIAANQINDLFASGALTERSPNLVVAERIKSKRGEMQPKVYSDFKVVDEQEAIQSRVRGKHSIPSQEELSKMTKGEFDFAWRTFKKFMKDGGMELHAEDSKSRSQKEKLMSSTKKLYVTRSIAQMEKTAVSKNQWKTMTHVLSRGNFGLDSMLNILASHDPSGVISDAMNALKTAETERAAMIEQQLLSSVKGLMPAKEASAQYKVQIDGQSVYLRGDEIASLLVMINDPDIKKALNSGETSLVFEKGIRSEKKKKEFFINKTDIANLKGVLPSEKSIVDGWRKFSMMGRDAALPVLKEIVKSKKGNFTGLTPNNLGAFDADSWAPVKVLEAKENQFHEKNSMKMNPSWVHKREEGYYKGKTLIVSDINVLASSHARNVAQIAGKGIELQNLYELLADKHNDTTHLIKGIPHKSVLRDNKGLTTFTEKLRTAFSQEINPFAQGDDVVRHPLFRYLKKGQDIFRLGNLWTMAKMASSSHLIIPFLNDSASYRAAILTKKKNNVTEDKFMENAFQWTRGETAVSQSAGDSMSATSGRAVVTGEKNFADWARSVVSKADRLAMRTIFLTAAYDTLPSEMPKTLGSLRKMKKDPEFFNTVQQKANRMVLETQPTSESYMRGDLQNRNTLLTVMLTRYSTQTNRMANMLWKSYNSHVTQNTPDASNYFLKTAMSVLVTNTLLLTMIGVGKKGVQELMAAMARSGDDDDDDELYAGEKKKTQYAMKTGMAARNSVAGLVQGGDEMMLLMDAIAGYLKGESYKTDWVMEKPMFMGEVKKSLETFGLGVRVCKQTKKMHDAERAWNNKDYMDAKRSLGYSYEKLYENILQLIGVGGQLPTKMLDNSYVKSKLRRSIYKPTLLDKLYK